MSDAFDRAVALVLEHEGFFSDDPDDPGGETYYGLSRKFNPSVRPWPPSKQQAIDIYRRNYWQPHRCGELPAVLGIALFDAVVNQPAVSMVEEFQRALHVEPDGIVGTETIHAAGRRDPWETIALFFARRARRYVQRSEEKFQIGLLARLFRTQRALLGAA